MLKMIAKEGNKTTVFKSAMPMKLNRYSYAGLEK